MSNKEIRISIRSDGSINVSLLAEKLGGGGHYTSAAAMFNSVDFKAIKEGYISIGKVNNVGW